MTIAAIAAVAVLPLDPAGETTGGAAAAEVAEIGLDGPWTTTVSRPWPRSLATPTTGHGRIYAVDGGAMYGLDASDGRIRWRHAEDEPLNVSPTAIGGVTVGASRAGLVGVDSSDGRPYWRTRTEGIDWRYVDTGPRAIVAGGVRGTTTGQIGVVALYDAFRGDERWIREFGDWMAGAPRWAAGMVVAPTHSGGRYGHVTGLDGSTGELRWEAELAGWPTVSIRDGVVYATTSHEAVAVDLEAGRERWRVELGLSGADEAGDAQHAIVDDELRIAFPNPEPTLVTLDVEDGTLRGEIELEELGGERRVELAATHGHEAVVGIVDHGTGYVRAVSGDGTIIWERRLGRPLGFGLAISPSRTDAGDGDVWVGGADGTLVALDLGTGEPRWERRLPPTAGWAPSLLSDGRLVLVNDHSDLVGLNASDGVETWRNEDLPAPGTRAIGPHGTVLVPSTGSVARRILELDAAAGAVLAELNLDPPSTVRAITADRNLIYAGTSTGVFAFEPTHRRQRWHSRSGSEIVELHSDGERLAAVDDGGRVHLLGTASGTRRWMRRADACTAPRLADGVVIVGTSNGVVALDADDGRQRWRVAASRPMCVPIAVGGDDGGLVYLTDLVRTVAGVAADDGRTVWRRRFDAGIAAPPGASSSAVVTGDAAGVLHLLDPADGSIIARHALPAALLVPPVVHPDGVVVLGDDGEVRALATGS